MKTKEIIISKISIFILMIILLITLFPVISKADERKGYVQIVANVDNEIRENKYAVELNVCEVRDDGLSKTVYLYENNNYATNITLPEGYYEISYAKVVGDDNNEYWFSIVDRDFMIKKDSPAIMYFGLGNVLNKQDNQDNQDDIKEDIEEITEDNEEDTNEQSLTKEEIKELKEIGLDIYNEDGTLNKEKISEEYKKEMGETIDDTLKEYNDAHPTKEPNDIKEEKEKNERKNKESIVSIIINVVSVIIILILLGMYGVYYVKKRYN